MCLKRLNLITTNACKQMNIQNLAFDKRTRFRFANTLNSENTLCGYLSFWLSSWTINIYCIILHYVSMDWCKRNIANALEWRLFGSKQSIWWPITRRYHLYSSETFSWHVVNKHVFFFFFFFFRKHLYQQILTSIYIIFKIHLQDIEWPR